MLRNVVTNGAVPTFIQEMAAFRVTLIKCAAVNRLFYDLKPKIMSRQLSLEDWGTLT
jgi:hypothetical protein